ncbi:DMT family transporter [Candidatus Daviesbacteria bacterium]|nr:DMT family transporter [Candidatus Daviesbacteria bacterium]
MGILLAVLSSIFLALANIFLKKSYKDFSPSISFFIFSLFALILWGSFGLVLGVQFSNFLFGFFVGLVSAILGQAIYFYVLSKGELSITATILSSYSIYTILFSTLFNKERLLETTLVLVILAILGTLIVSSPEKGKFNKEDLKKLSFILWAIFAAVGIGAADTLTKYYITKTSVGSFLFYVSIAQFIISFIYLRLEKESLGQFKSILSKLKEYKYALLGSLTVSISVVFLFLAFSFTLASIVSPINASYPVLTVLLALIFLKEKITPKNAIGLALVIISIIGVGFVSS